MIANDDINDDVKASPSLIQKITMSRKKASSTDPSLEMGCEPGGASNENERSMEEEDFFFLIIRAHNIFSSKYLGEFSYSKMHSLLISAVVSTALIMQPSYLKNTEVTVTSYLKHMRSRVENRYGFTYIDFSSQQSSLAIFCFLRMLALLIILSPHPKFAGAL
jgi:hypothetical protein